MRIAPASPQTPAPAPLLEPLSRAEIKRVVRKVETLPTLPVVAAKVLKILSESDVDLEEVVRLIETDQAITLKILRLVNSAYYGLSTRVSSIRNAVVMLGIAEVRCVLLSVTVSEAIIKSLRQSCAHDQDLLWKHSLACAVCADLITRELYPGLRAEAFVCGLLHDVGKLILEECFPENTERIKKYVSEHGVSWLQAEQNIMGVDHPTVGKWLAEKWNLPEIFVQAIWLHHQPMDGLKELAFLKNTEAVLAINLANYLAHEVMADYPHFFQTRNEYQDILTFFRIKSKDLDKLLTSVGKHYSERASILDLEENELSFYYQALQRANQKLAALASQNARYLYLQKINHELGLLQDLQLTLSRVEEADRVIESVASTLALEMKRPEGVIYCRPQSEAKLFGAYWRQGVVTPFSVPLNEHQMPTAPAAGALPDEVAQLIATQPQRDVGDQARRYLPHLIQCCRPYLVIPFVMDDRVIGEIGIAAETGLETEAMAKEELRLYQTLASVTETALAHCALVERLKENTESLGAALSKNNLIVRALKRSQEEFENLFEYSNDAVLIHTAEGTALRINQKTMELTGYQKEELVGRPAWQKLFPEIPASASPRQHAALIAGTRYETQLRCKNGVLIEVEVSSRIIDKASKVVQSIIRDISRQKQTARALYAEKERLAVTLRSIGDGVITTDTQGKVVLINKEAERLTGWTLEEAQGQPLAVVFNLVHSVTHEQVESPAHKVLTTGKVMELSPGVSLRSKQGTERAITDSVAPILDNEHHIIGAVLVFRDITEKQKLEQEMLKAQKFESIGILAGGIAHDFNNILTAISGNVTLAKMYLKPGEKAYEKLTKAENASVRAKDLTHQLLTFSRGGAPVKRTASLAEIIKDSSSFALRGSNVRCEYAIPKDLWPVEVDEGQINQVINNIIINADQAMPGGGIITVSAQNILTEEGDGTPLAPGRYVRVSVKDQGVGIPPADLAKVFDPYFTTKRSGNGLGLTTAYSIIKKHEGYIYAESEPGKGTTFTFLVPACGPQPLVAHPEDEKPLQGKGRVLLMDDEEEIRELAGEMLKSIGYDVELAKDGSEAIETYKHATAAGCPFDVLIMDLTIPGSMGGKEAVKILKEFDPQVKAIVSSGYANDPVMADYQKFGFTEVIAKPYKIAELSKVLHRTINHHGETESVNDETTNGKESFRR